MGEEHTWDELEPEEPTGGVVSTWTPPTTGQPELKGWSIRGGVGVHGTDLDDCLEGLLILVHHRAVVLRKHREVVIDVLQRDNQRACAGLWW